MTRHISTHMYCYGIVLAALLFLSGCNSYSRHFQSAITDPHPPLSAYSKYNLVAFDGEVEIRHENHTPEMVAHLIEDGYVLLGHAAFNAAALGDAPIKRQAQRIGAELAIASIQYAGSAQSSFPITTFSPQTYYHSGTVNSSAGTATYSGSSTGYTTSTTYAPISYSRYDHYASFWTRHTKPGILGATFRELSPKQRSRIGANQGVLVLACIRNSPAWRGNLLPGDIVLAIDNEPISSTRSIYTVLEEKAGRRVRLMIDRAGGRRHISIQLNPNPINKLESTMD